MQGFCMAVINHQIQQGPGLKKIGRTTSLLGGFSYAANDVRLHTEQFGEYRNYQRSFAVFNGPQHQPLGFM